MKLDNIPCCEKPSTIVFIDDDDLFLETIKIALSRSVNLLLFNNPEAAISYLNETYQHNSLIERCLSSDDEQPPDMAAGLHIDINSIHTEIYNANRFKEIPVVVTDYSMPGLNGINVSQKIQRKEIKKLLLTGEAGYNLAVEAFNDRLIDKFLLKGVDNLVEKIRSSINALQKSYYQSLSEPLYVIAEAGEKSLRCLSDEKYINLFNNTLKERQIVEFYILDTHGSFLMLDENAKMTWFIMKGEEEMLNLVSHAKFAQAPNDIIKKLEDRTHVLFLFPNPQLNTEPSSWAPYLYPAKKLESEKIYYYSIISENDCHPLNHSSIVSYRDFMNQQ